MRLKKILCGVLAIVMTLPLTSPLNSFAASKFTDTANHWAADYINSAISKNLISGYPDGSFRPDKAVTRAEFASMMNKALGNSGTATISFGDTNSSDWYYNDVAKALAASYAAGYSDNTFRPENPITRQEAAVMIARIVPTYGAGGNLKSYSDSGSIADWAYDSLQKINGKGYIGAYQDGKIHPEDPLTRAQTAKIICDIVDRETIISKSTVVDADETKLSNKIYSNSVTIDEDLDDGSATIDGCVILGNLSVQGGGTDSITVSNSRVVNASVSRSSDSVRLIAKGETAILKLSASKTSILQTSSLAGGLFGPGFSNISVGSSASVTLKGSFPSVIASGSKAQITLDSGTISNLIVDGKYSEITVEDDATISSSTVNAESYFHGTGTISKMKVNADGVTYETKPRDWTLAKSSYEPTQGDGASGDITFSPKNGATGVKLDAKMTITFSSAMEMADGDSISSSDIEDFIELRKSSSTGTKIDFSGSINSAKKIITITPGSALSKDTKYYLIMEEDSIRDENDDKNAKQVINFTTGSDSNSITTTYHPVDGATTIPTNTSITLAFSEAVVRYSNGDTISTNDSYLKNCIVFRKNSSSGDTVAFTASINSSKKIITITPTSSLILNQKYYIALSSESLKTSDDGEKIPSSSASWTTGITQPVLSSFSATAGDTSISATATPNVAGKVYAVVVPSGASSPSSIQIAAGQDSSGASALGATKNESVSASASVSLSSMSGFASGTNYDVWATLYSTASGSYSTPVKKSVTTTIPRVSLDNLTVKPIVSGSTGTNQISYKSSTTSYNTTLNSSITEVEISASGDSAATITMTGDGISSLTGTGTLSSNINIAANPVITVSISSSGKTSSSYTIQLSTSDDASLKRLEIDGASQGTSSSMTYALSTSGAATVVLNVEANDDYAQIEAPISSSVTVNTISSDLGAARFSLDFAEGSEPAAIELKVVSGSTSTTYTITFTRP